MKAYFRKSAKPLATRYLILASLLLLAIKLITIASWMAAFSFSGVMTGLYILILYFKSYHRRYVSVDDEGIEQGHDGMKVRLKWGEVTGLDVEMADVFVGKTPVRIRYAMLTDAWRRQVAFCDLALISGRSALVSSPGGALVSDVAGAELLLAICARRVGSPFILDKLRGRGLPVEGGPEEGWRDVEGVPAAQSGAGGDTAPGAGWDEGVDPRVFAPPGSRRRLSVPGLLILAAKVGGKLLKGVFAALKTIKPGFALASGAVYGLFFSWKFALALMVMLFVHEYGHVHAMRRSGLRVKGIYFIPFLGAAAVTDDAWRTRSQQAYIALNGPLWGLLLTVVPFLLAFHAQGQLAVFAGGVAAWWAFINLFNLLPINPLDGGRVLSALGYSVSSRLGLAVTFVAFIACLVIAFSFNVFLFAILGVVGFLEFLSELAAGLDAAKLRLAVDVGEVSPEGLVFLRTIMRPPFQAADEEKIRGMDLARAHRLLSMARIRPMTGGTAARWIALYLVLSAALIAIILLLAGRPEVEPILKILR